MNYKALVSFFSQEHGAVSAGSEMTIKDQALASEYKSAGYIEEMGAEMTPNATEMKKATRRTKAGAMDTEFSSEMTPMNAGAPMSDSQMTAQSQLETSQGVMGANAFDTEFSQELGAVQDQASAEMTAQQDQQSAKQVGKTNKANK